MMLMGWMGLSAQGISVTSFKPLPNDLTANLAGTQVKDQNGEVAALIKVVTTQTGFTFEGGMAGIVKTKQEVGEIWVYVPHGIQKITIKHPQLGVLRDYYFPCAIDEARTYEMVLAAGEVRTVVTQDAGGSFLALTVEPKSASVYIDGELQPVDDNGELMVMLPYGEHQYRIEANGYMNEAGIIAVGKETVTKAIRLKSALATLKINSTTPGADIIVNNQKRGTGSWSGSLTAGMYLIECQKPGYHSYQTSITLAKQEEKVLTIPELSAKYGSMVVSVKPIGSEVWMDGSKLGTSPGVFNNVLATKHNIEVKKAGYQTLRKTIELTEGDKFTLDGALEKEQAAAPKPAPSNGGNTTPRSGSGSSGGGSTPRSSSGSSGTVSVNGVNIDMVYVQGGTFMMGKDGSVDDEMPEHQVTLSSYYIGKYEVTQALWNAVMGSITSQSYAGNGDNKPVANITYANIQEFIRRLNSATGKRFRLPTEAEWEYAARGGNQSRGYKFSGSNDASEVAWYNVGDHNSRPVGTKKPNELGIYDMSGNLEEWTADYWSKYTSSSQTNPKGGRSGKRVVRGGGYWHSLDWAQRVARRSAQDESSSIFGFRLAHDADGTSFSQSSGSSGGSSTPRSSSGSLQLFPVWGITLGNTTVSDMKRLGFTVEPQSSGANYSRVHSIQFWDHSKDGVYETIYFPVSTTAPDLWTSQGLNGSLSYNEFIRFFTSRGFTYKVTKEPQVKKWQNRNTLSANLMFYSNDGNYSFEVDFDYGNDNGEGYTVDSKNTAYSFRVKALKSVAAASGSSAPRSSSTPRSGSGSLKLFPVWGVDLGKSTVSDLKAQGYKVENRSDGDKYASIRGIQCWDFSHDGRFETMYFTYYDGIPSEWEAQGFNTKMSYNEYIRFFTSHGYTYTVKEAPQVKKYEKRNTLSAELEFTSADGRYVIRIDFDYGNDNGEGYTVDSKCSAYSFNIKAK